MHLPTLISDLVVIIIAAGLMTLLFKRLKQPVVLGYILAGVLAGPSIQFIPTVSDTVNINTWGEIGVIFLLFNLGLDFSIKKLMKVGGTAIVGAMTVLIGMMTTGYLVGTAIGLDRMNCIFLGAMLSMSSTTIIFKAFDEMGLRNKQFAGVVFGILIVEDIFAVLMLVLLSTLAVSQTFEGQELLLSMTKLALFLVGCFVFGIYFIPSMLKALKKILNDEMLLIISIGFCLGLVYVADWIGFSSALGAFMMGAILAETIEAEHIESLVKPVKDLFAAVFFVSVGMLIDLNILWEYKWHVAILTITVMIGQLFFGSFGVLLSGKPVKTAIQSGFSLTQIGEFAFIIASQGIALKVMEPHLYPLIVAVSVVTTFFTPYMIRLAEPAYNGIERALPPSWKQFLDQYTSGSNTIRHQSEWRKYLRSMSRIVGIYLAVTLVLIFAWLQLVAPLIRQFLPGENGNILALVLLIALMAPLLRAIMMKKNRSKAFRHLWNDSKYNRGPLVSLIVLRIIVCMGLVAIPTSALLSTKWGIVLVASLSVIAIMIFSKRVKKHSILMERHFVSNLSAREAESERRAPIRRDFANHLLERDLHLTDIEVRPHSPSIGKTLKELNFRQKCNVNIVTIIRGERRINIPGGDEYLYPLDKLIIVGSDDDILHFHDYIAERYHQADQERREEEADEMNIEQFTISEGSRLIGLSIRESGIRDKAQCLVIGIERGKTSIKNPPPSTVFEEGDIVWIVGERRKVIHLSEGKTL